MAYYYLLSTGQRSDGVVRCLPKIMARRRVKRREKLMKVSTSRKYNFYHYHTIGLMTKQVRMVPKAVARYSGALFMCSPSRDLSRFGMQRVYSGKNR